MNTALLENLLDKALARQITFPEIVATLANAGVESYHVDFLRDECRYYAKSGESLVVGARFVHGDIAPGLCAEKLADINRRVQSGQTGYADFVAEGAAAGCAYYIVYLNGRLVRYFGRDGGEHVQYFPGSR